MREQSGKLTQHTVMGSKGPIDSLKQAVHHKTEFVGYETIETDATIIGIVAGKPAPNDRLCDKMEEIRPRATVSEGGPRQARPSYGESQAGKWATTGTTCWQRI